MLSRQRCFKCKSGAFPRRSPAQHFAIAVGTCCEMEENSEIAFATRGHSWAPAPGHAVGRDAVGAGLQPWECGLLQPGPWDHEPRTARFREVTMAR